jgi:Kef-type K+ transport system membrane component KefB
MSFILGGLGARVDLLKQNFTLSMIGATTGVLFPIGLSYLLLYLGFGYGGFWLPNFYSKRLTWTRCG